MLDPIVPEPGNASPRSAQAQALNRYAYVYNNPLKYVDSSGHVPIVPLLIVGGIILLKAIDYGWTAWDVYQSTQVLADPHAGAADKAAATANLALTVATEAAEPDDLLLVSLPLDDLVQHGIIAFGKRAADDVVDADGVVKAADDLPAIIWRSGDTSPSNLTPRPQDEGMLSFRDSLSNPWPLALGQRPPLPADKGVIGVDPKQLPVGSVVRDRKVGSVATPPGHVSVSGASVEQLKKAVAYKGKPGQPPKPVKQE